MFLKLCEFFNTIRAQYSVTYLSSWNIVDSMVDIERNARDFLDKYYAKCAKRYNCIGFRQFVLNGSTSVYDVPL